jgi:hypothetical protein
MKAGIFRNMPFQYFNELYDAANIVKYFLSANFFLHLLPEFTRHGNKIFIIFVSVKIIR